MPVVTSTDLVGHLADSPAKIPPQITAATAENSRSVRILYAAISIALIVLVCVFVTMLVTDPDFSTRPKPAAPVEGLTILAVFFVGALAIERLLEPIAGVLLPKAEKEAKARNTASAASQKVDAATIAGPGADKSIEEARDALQTAATAKAELSDWVWSRTILYWALASSIGIYVSAAMKLYLLRTVGIGDAGRWQEVLATGLIIGAGTKPLHDLTKLIVAQKTAKQAAQ